MLCCIPFAICHSSSWIMPSSLSVHLFCFNDIFQSPKYTHYPSAINLNIVIYKVMIIASFAFACHFVSHLGMWVPFLPSWLVCFAKDILKHHSYNYFVGLLMILIIYTHESRGKLHAFVNWFTWITVTRTIWFTSVVNTHKPPFFCWVTKPSNEHQNYHTSSRPGHTQGTTLPLISGLRIQVLHL